RFAASGRSRRWRRGKHSISLARALQETSVCWQEQVPMISHTRFGKLRLVQFRPDAEIAQLQDWEFKGHRWVGEPVGFSEWLRLENKSDTLRSLAIDFSEFPKQAALEVLRAIDLPVKAGMKFQDLCELLGEPVKEHRFVKDRVSFDFALSGPPKYNIN